MGSHLPLSFNAVSWSFAVYRNLVYALLELVSDDVYPSVDLPPKERLLRRFV